METYDAIIVGSGIIGCGIAYGLAQQGRRVLTVDKNPAAGYGSTSSSSAIIRTFYSTRDGCALAWEGLHVWRDWQNFLGAGAEEGADAGHGDDLATYVECPTLVLQNGEPDGLDAACRHLTDLNVPWEFWDLAQVIEHMPQLDPRRFAPARQADDPRFGEPAGGELTGALYFPDGGYVTDPQLAARNLQHAAERNGAGFRFNTRVTGIRIANNRAAGIEVDGGEANSAPVIVNAAGPYSASLNDKAGVADGMAIHTRPMRQEVSHVPRPNDMVAPENPRNLVVLDTDVGSYFRTEGADALFVGGTEPACDPFVWVDDPDTLERNPTDQWRNQVMRQALRLPTLGIPGQARRVADLYDVSDDWIPIYDRSDLPGFYMAIGTSGNQFKNGPIAGQLMAGLIDHCERNQGSGHDHDSAPFQFAMPYTGLMLNTGTFSRRRVTTADSTMSVLG